MQLNLFDTLFAGVLIISVLAGCLRGSGREMLHALLFGLAMLAGWLFLRVAPLPHTQLELGRLTTSISFYVLVMYILSWGLMRMLAPLMLDSAPVGLRSRFWAGALATGKMLAALFGVNLWYAVHSYEPYGPRLAPLPLFFQDSVLIRLSDRATDDLHRWLAAQGFVRYQFDAHGAYIPLPGEEPPAKTEATPAADGTLVTPTQAPTGKAVAPRDAPPAVDRPETFD